MKAFTSLGLPFLAAALSMVTTASKASTIIAFTSFEEAAFESGEYIDADITDHFLVNKPGEPIVQFTPTGGQQELSFTTFFSDVRGVTVQTGLSDGDLIGVKRTSSVITSYPDGIQGYRFQDPDGTLTVTPGTVNLTNYVDPKVSAFYFLSSEEWETTDFARIWVEVDGSTDIDLLSTIGSDIDNLSIEGSWNELMANLTGYSTAVFKASFSSDNANEEMWIDNIRFTATSLVPEPGRTALLAMAGIGLLARRRRKL